MIPATVTEQNIAIVCSQQLWQRAGRQGWYGCMQELRPEQVVALVSCTVWQERAEGGQKVRQDMQGPFAALTEAARTVAKVHFHSPHCQHPNTARIRTLPGSKHCNIQRLAVSRDCQYVNTASTPDMPEFKH